jgi:hypothetical protein
VTRGFAVPRRGYERSEQSTEEDIVQTDIWTYREKSKLGSNVMDTRADITGFGVEALDGGIGKVDEATYEVGRSYLIVDTGPWIFGRKVMLPAGVVRGIDETEEKVFVNRTKDQIKEAPEFDETLVGETGYESELGSYYGPGGRGYRNWDDLI